MNGVTLAAVACFARWYTVSVQPRHEIEEWIWHGGNVCGRLRALRGRVSEHSLAGPVRLARGSCHIYLRRHGGGVAPTCAGPEKPA